MSELTPWEKYKQNLGQSRPWHILSSELRTTEEIASSRLSICMSCPEIIPVTRQCKKCGCLMSLKTKITDSVCPIGKW
jgi:uncharacterized Fe-S radical SAM superfamily protein PflX